MKANKFVQFSIGVAAVSVIFALTVSCTRRVTIPETKPIEQTDESGWQIFSEPALNEEMDSDLEWTKYDDGKFAFDYPVGWSIEVEQNRIELKNTEKEIITGGAAPEDYYIDGAAEVNVEKYASDYYLLTIDLRDNSGDWDEFFALNYGGIIMAYQPYFLPTRPDLTAVAPTKVSGAILGETRFFVRKGKSVFDFSLFRKGADEKQAQKILNTFLKNFSF